MQEPETDHRVPESDDGPGRSDDERHEDAPIEHRPAVVAKDARHRIGEDGDGGEIQCGDERPALENKVRSL
jgi:hypothetical protein